MWVPMDIEDALELLSPNYTNPAVRRYAISRLQQAPDNEILLYLLQLVQALKYESFATIKEGTLLKKWACREELLFVAGFARLASGYEVYSISEETSNNCLEKKDSKDSNCTVTTETVLQKSSSFNKADELASSVANSVVEVETAPVQPVTVLVAFLSIFFSNRFFFSQPDNWFPP